jgi:type I restriction enzyme S subunit
MNDVALSENWKLVKLGNVCTLRHEATNPSENPNIACIGLEHIDSGVPCLTRKGLALEVKSSKSKFYKGDVLYGKLRPYLDKVVLAEYDGICSTDILVLKSNDLVLPLFLGYFLHTDTFLSYAVKTTKGVNHPRTSWASLAKFEFFLPQFHEQRAIVHALQTVQKTIESRRREIAKEQERKAALMQHLFTHGTRGEARKVTEIGEVPESWQIIQLKNIATVKYGKAKQKKIGTIPVIGSSGIYAWASEPLIGYPTLVVGRKGTAGKVWLQLQPCYPADTTFYLEWKKQVVDIHFLYYFMSIYPLSGEHAKTTIPSLQKHELENYTFPFPTLSQQKKIVEILQACDKKITALKKEAALLDELFKAMREELMTGKLSALALNDIHSIE